MEGAPGFRDSFSARRTLRTFSIYPFATFSHLPHGNLLLQDISQQQVANDWIAVVATCEKLVQDLESDAVFLKTLIGMP